MNHAPLIWAIGLLGCTREVGDVDGAFYDNDGRFVHCAVNLDTSANNDLVSIDTALDRAASRGEVFELYGHRPGRTIPTGKLQDVLVGAVERGLTFFTYADFAAGTAVGPGIALSFDDSDVESWLEAQPLFAEHGARVTFFVTRYHEYNPFIRDRVFELAAAGHDIAAHGANHLRAPEYVEENGLAAYLADEAIPSIEVLRADGYNVTSFAYPFGARTDEIDRALRLFVPILRSVAFSQVAAVSPCPQ